MPLALRAYGIPDLGFSDGRLFLVEDPAEQQSGSKIKNAAAKKSAAS
jgi:hypothetical protein